MSLRMSALTSGPETTTPSAQPTPAPRGEPAARLVSGRGVLAGLLVFTGSMHLLVAAGRGVGWKLEGFALAVAGIVSLVLGLAVVVTDRRWAMWAALLVSTLGAATLSFTRTVGYPFGPYDATAPSPSGLELVLVATQLVAGTIAAAGLFTSGKVLGPRGWHIANLAPLAVAVAAVPGLAAGSWVQDAAGGLITGDHTHDTTVAGVPLSTLTADERAVLGGELVEVRDLALSLPTLADALEAGWSRVGVGTALDGLLAVPPQASGRPGTFAIDRPLGLVYASDSPGAAVVGVEYALWPDDGEAPEGFTGGDDIWHPHAGTCTVVAGGGRPELHLPLDAAVTGVDCELVGGELDPETAWMLRVWAVPGWENPAGIFAHQHPALG